jgi:precorrin-2 dehydrogenase/sirohydrochlorin ferrochelatase
VRRVNDSRFRVTKNQFPINLNLEGRSCLVVGAGRIGLRKTEQLLAAGARVTVIAPEVVGDFAGLPVTLHQRAFELTDLDGQRLVITATGNRELDQLIYDTCEERGIWINSADDPERCAFTLPAVVRRGDLMVTVSTGGNSPALSSWMRQKLEALVGPEFEEVVNELAQERVLIHADGRSTEDIDWKPIIEKIVASHNIHMSCPRESLQGTVTA